jgi:glycosyltransferase involved in cell wall biosynthesis
MPRISVCLASYNGERFIGDQLASILQQLSGDDEVIVSDDGSRDATLARVRAFADARIRLVVNQGRRGPTWNFEHALRHARGRYIFLADQDDVWLPAKVDRMLHGLSHAVLAVSDCVLVDVEGRVLGESFFGSRGSKPGLLHNLFKNSYLGCCMAFRKEVLALALPFPDRIYTHDAWIGLVAEAMWGTFFIPERLILYRRHAQSYSPTAGPSPNTTWTRIRMRYHMIAALVRRVGVSRLLLQVR